jgi:alpha-galactosidase
MAMTHVDGQLKLRWFAACARRMVLTVGLLMAQSAAFGANLTGRWAPAGAMLDNGERDRSLLELEQQGGNLSGRYTTLGWTNEVRGTVTGNHFVLYWSTDPQRPVGSGEFEHGELVGNVLGNPGWTARRATAADELPKVPYIAPPTLEDVPDNGLARTPPMGWNSWNLFAGRIDDATVRAMADAMISSGMRDAGYVYVNIDDTWEGVRDAGGNLQPNHKFPDMKALADYVHSKGLKLGIYSSPGARTCGSYPASYGHEAQDAKTFAAWHIDYLKYDWCSAAMVYTDADLRAVYQRMGSALVATGRPIVYSLCEYGRGRVETWGSKVGGNLWRTTEDIRDEWPSMIDNVERQVPTAPYAGPGHWNDPDMLEVGNGHMTEVEYRTHMSLWALVAAPLLAGNDIRSMTPAIRQILMNTDVIAVDQDPRGAQASPVRKGRLETWVKPLADGGAAVGVVNLGESPEQAAVSAGDLPGGAVTAARDLWRHQDVEFENGIYRAMVPSHGVLLLRVKSTSGR